MYLSEEVQNFTESLVEDVFEQQGVFERYDGDTVQDLFCLVLNQLPPRYLRHSVDVRINITPEEQQAINSEILEAIDQGLQVIRSNRRKAER